MKRSMVILTKLYPTLMWPVVTLWWLVLTNTWACFSNPKWPHTPPFTSTYLIPSVAGFMVIVTICIVNPVQVASNSRGNIVHHTLGVAVVRVSNTGGRFLGKIGLLCCSESSPNLSFCRNKQRLCLPNTLHIYPPPELTLFMEIYTKSLCLIIDEAIVQFSWLIVDSVSKYLLNCQLLYVM